MDKLQLMDVVVKEAQRAVPELAVVYCLWQYLPETRFSTTISGPEGLDLDALVANADHVLVSMFTAQAATDNVVRDIPTEGELFGDYGRGLKGFPALEEPVELCWEAGWNVFMFAESPVRAGGVLKIRGDREAQVSLKHAYLDCKRELMVEWHNAAHVQLSSHEPLVIPPFRMPLEVAALVKESEGNMRRCLELLRKAEEEAGWDTDSAAQPAKNL